MTGLDGEYDPNNIFAKILRGDVTAVKVYEDDVAVAIMDLFPQAQGHTLAERSSWMPLCIIAMNTR